MFNSKMTTTTRNTSQETGAVNIIGAGTAIDGDISCGGDIRIDGNLKGTINTRGKLVVGPSGVVEGEVFCQNADISGEIRGKVNVTELLTLKATAKLSGELVTGKLAIEPGADFSGSCAMADIVKNTLHEHKQVAIAEQNA
jgi:cytoskeletal protein CcmA (bactofilin family)